MTMWEAFIEEYRSCLQDVKTMDDLKRLYKWFWDRRHDLDQIAAEMNQALGIRGEKYMFKAFLPVLHCGPTDQLTVTSFNPAYHKCITEACAARLTSFERYWTYVDRFLTEGPICEQVNPDVMPELPRYWRMGLWWVQLLRKPLTGYGDTNSMAVRLEIAAKERVIGGWELFPFYSQADGLSGRLSKYPWLKNCFQDSVQAILRLGPETLLVSSREGYDIVVEDLLPNETWLLDQLEHNPRPVCVAYCRPEGSRTEIITIRWQILSQPPVDFPVILAKFLELRRRYAQGQFGDGCGE
jgi:hypothetical protein